MAAGERLCPSRQHPEQVESQRSRELRVQASRQVASRQVAVRESSRLPRSDQVQAVPVALLPD